MKRFRSLILLMVLLITACTNTSTPTATMPTSAGVATLPEPQVNITPAPDVKETAVAFLDLWATEDYESMYAMLSTLSKDAFPKEEFIDYYRQVAVKMSLNELDYEITSALTNPRTAQVGYRVSFSTVLVGTFSRETLMNLVFEDGSWKVQWESTMILPELQDGNQLSMEITVPARGNIYDRNGDALVAESEVVALGITPGKIEEGREGTLLTYLSRLTGLNPDYIASLYENAGDDWYIPVGETARANVDRYWDTLAGLGGLEMNFYTARYYFNGGGAAHVTGYIQDIFLEEVEEYGRLGYRQDEKVGRTGLEKWGEDYLVGQRGANLRVVDPTGVPVTSITRSDTLPSDSIYTTVDKDFQYAVERAIEGFKGAAVVLERDTGRVLAMASTPTFDPNLFDPNNYNYSWMINDMLNAEDNRLLNRAAQSAYPLGSVFKIITMATALETETFTPEEIYFCGNTFTELPGQTFYDWTYEKELPPSGDLNISGALMRSCNPWFYHIGLTLFERNLPNALSDMARAFGLGSPTGIGQVAEVSGNIPNATTAGDVVQLSIGQGSMLVTPLQVATFIAAIGNGGTLYQPQLVEKIVNPNGEAIEEFEPIKKGDLPISDETLSLIQGAMRDVVAENRGTAHYAMLGLQVPVYGKTGTAQNEPLDSHAWFAGYTNLGDSTRPDIAIVVLAENAGEGSEVAAPMFRRIVEEYFFGKALRLYPWETTFYVTQTPTSPFDETPTDQPPAETPEP